MEGTGATAARGERSRTGPGRAEASHIDRGIFNWLWLIDLPSRGSALIVGDRAKELTPELALHFDDAQSLEWGEREAGGLLPYGRQAFDCVILLALPPTRAEQAASRRDYTRLLGECRRILRPGGCLHVAVEGRIFTSPLRRGLQRAGFRDVRAYYAPELRVGLRFLLPATRRAAEAYERTKPNATTPRTARLRRWVARLGAHALLHHRLVFLART